MSRGEHSTGIANMGPRCPKCGWKHYSEKPCRTSRGGYKKKREPPMTWEEFRMCFQDGFPAKPTPSTAPAADGEGE